MIGWSRRRLERLFDVDQVQRAVEAAERRTSGEIRVSIAPFFWGSVDRAAQKAFDRLGMARTRHRNGVLIFIVPSRRSFVILGDSGIHERAGQELWDRAAAMLSEHFRKGGITEGLVRAIEAVGDALAVHFPPEAGDVDELSNQVDMV